MKAPIAVTVLLALPLIFAAATPARATADGPDFFMVRGVASDDVLNIRAEPSASAAKIGEIPPDGSGLQNLGCEGGLSFAEWQEATEAEREAAQRRTWCRISYEGTQGWVAAQFLTEASQPAAAIADEPTQWGVVSINGEPPVAQAFLAFAPDGSLSGSTGCNRFRMQGIFDAGAVRIDGPAMMTKVACPDGAIDRQEKTILAGLQGRIALEFDPFTQEITLDNAEAGVTMRLAPMLQ